MVCKRHPAAAGCAHSHCMLRNVCFQQPIHARHYPAVSASCQCISCIRRCVTLVKPPGICKRHSGATSVCQSDCRQSVDRDPSMLQLPRPCMQAAGRTCTATAAGAPQPRTCSAAIGGRSSPTIPAVVLCNVAVSARPQQVGLYSNSESFPCSSTRFRFLPQHTLSSLATLGSSLLHAEHLAAQVPTPDYIWHRSLHMMTCFVIVTCCMH